MASNEPDREEDAAGAAAGEDEDTGAQTAPIVTLSEVAVTTAEEAEDVVLDLSCLLLVRKAQLYRFDKAGSQWKESGTGNVKLLKHRGDRKGATGDAPGQDPQDLRQPSRWSKSFFLDFSLLVLVAGLDFPFSFLSCSVDQDSGTCCVTCSCVTDCRKFMEMVEGIVESLGQTVKDESKDASDAAEQLDKLSVEQSKIKKSSGEVPAATSSVKPEDENSQAETKAEEATKG
ncbi:ran-binding protein [Canna indica]|uniref:Ran-binding protein n=1 Tax=Canna indica TaxID=4628 RepID=A0AAQ3KZK6_9LILI|nr:ran-binding protein [Canna indica]